VSWSGIPSCTGKTRSGYNPPRDNKVFRPFLYYISSVI
jgi:hypothetical protein